MEEEEDGHQHTNAHGGGEVGVDVSATNEELVFDGSDNYLQEEQQQQPPSTGTRLAVVDIVPPDNDEEELSCTGGDGGAYLHKGYNVEEEEYDHQHTNAHGGEVGVDVAFDDSGKSIISTTQQQQL
eukprot:TRINITY_DN68081_c7_g1_i4.p2 TRINITY_DN68081_c7_g1~~TRINITY_DN68081_c7_g1_i4.p2  ORF type:complete len:126 (+),score=56.35 TRINITY_DN68081_c7_g1_i4:536-913(+)